MGSAALATSRPLKFWLLAEFLSPAFDAPALAAALGVDIELLDSPPWPEFLTDDLDRSKVGIRGDKQRLIWAYKLLFLDALFLGRTDRVIFVDADQVVLGDLAELFDMDLRDAPYASGQHKRATFPTSKAPISAIFHSFWLIFGRAIISRNCLEA